MAFHKCSQSNCFVDVDSRCLEGHEVENCPFYKAFKFDGVANEAVTEEDVDGPEQQSAPGDPEYVTIYDAKAMTFEEAEQYLRARAVIVVVLAGRQNCGKTTIITTLIQLFQQRENFNDFLFAGSRTLHGFELRCHPSRLISMASKEDTIRTPQFIFDEYLSARAFLQLTLKKHDKYYDFLIADISGEIFDQLTTSTELCKKLAFLTRCDNFTLIFDCKTLSEKPMRGEAKTKTISMLRSLDDAGMLSGRSQIQVVFSKWDVLTAKEDEASQQEFIDGIKTGIQDEFSASYPNLSFFEIASRPTKSSAMSIGFGLGELLDTWSNASTFRKTPRFSQATRMTNAREYLNYKFTR